MDKLAVTMYFGERGLRTARYKIWLDQNYTFCTICSLIDLHLETHDLISYRITRRVLETGT